MLGGWEGKNGHNRKVRRASGSLASAVSEEAVSAMSSETNLAK